MNTRRIIPVTAIHLIEFGFVIRIIVLLSCILIVNRIWHFLLFVKPKELISAFQTKSNLFVNHSSYKNVRK